MNSASGGICSNVSVLPQWRCGRNLVLAALALSVACGGSAGDVRPVDSLLPDAVPETLLVRFETRRGPFDVEVVRDWAPVGARRVRDLVAAGFFDENAFYR